MRSFPAAVLLCGTALAASLPTIALADGDKAACVTAHAEGQRLRREGRLLDAKARFELCARETCPGPVAAECATFFAEVERELPTVVLAARDRDGRDTAEARVFLDGAPWAERLGGRPLPLDPGEHTVRFVRPDGELTLTVVARAGDKNREVAADFSTLRARPTPPPPAPTPAAPPPSSSLRTAGFVIGGAGAAGLVAFGILGTVALTDANDLQSSCAPHCDARAGDVASMRHTALAADVALVAGAALVTTGVILVLAGRPSRPATTGFLAPSTAAVARRPLAIVF